MNRGAVLFRLPSDLACYQAVENEMEFLPGLLILMVMAVPYLLMGYDKVTGSALACKYFGWHNGNSGDKSFDGCSVHAVCDKCGKEVMQDSQGNWF